VLGCNPVLKSWLPLFPGHVCHPRSSLPCPHSPFCGALCVLGTLLSTLAAAMAKKRQLEADTPDVEEVLVPANASDSSEANKRQRAAASAAAAGDGGKAAVPVAAATPRDSEKGPEIAGKVAPAGAGAGVVTLAGSPSRPASPAATTLPRALPEVDATPRATHAGAAPAPASSSTPGNAAGVVDGSGAGGADGSSAPVAVDLTTDFASPSTRAPHAADATPAAAPAPTPAVAATGRAAVHAAALETLLDRVHRTHLPHAGSLGPLASHPSMAQLVLTLATAGATAAPVASAAAPAEDNPMDGGTGVAASEGPSSVAMAAEVAASGPAAPPADAAASGLTPG
jgi:hypothetical protein